MDEIEYVTGGADTEWGAERAKDGHPEPFKLRYVEIGNEEWFDKSGSYDERFAQFANAIKAKYPELQLIATAPVKGVKPDVLDEHFYVRATQNFKSASRYDKTDRRPEAAPQWDNGHYDRADRNGPKIFVGEWATREGSPTPNMGAALGDAAWMTGLERNSDLVIMVLCAAPGQCESRGHAVGDGPHWIRHAEELRLAGLLCAGNVWLIPWRSHPRVGVTKRRAEVLLFDHRKFCEETSLSQTREWRIDCAAAGHRLYGYEAGWNSEADHAERA
jgi:hypothetical protein